MICKSTVLHDKLLEGISLVKRGNKNLETSANHSRVTAQLLKNRVEAAILKNGEYCKEVMRNITKGEELYTQLKFKEGQRGEMRGNLGIKVESVRMVEIINEEISHDLERLNDKTAQLKSLGARCR
jgi:hypothetical protein